MQRDLDAEIAQARERIAELDRLRNDAAAHLRDLHRLHAPHAVEAQANNDAERSPASKVRLFRDLFSGREDVFAVRWENRVRGRAGYAPRCEHEWKPGVCGKPKVRCGACSNQAFVSVGYRELLAHFQGHQVVGIYPLLPNDTCRLLAIDLDGSSWQSDARAIRETCRSFDLESAIERSRSGNGAHVWFFFAGAVAASDARRLGLMILTRTMSSGAALGVDSYDRLFPSQDVLPSGGFGNLIALPLQLQARKLGNTEFLNDELDPHQDQWSYLASVPRIAPDLLGELIARSEPDGRSPSGRPLRTRACRGARRARCASVSAENRCRRPLPRPSLTGCTLIGLRFLPRWRTPSNA